jgi:hypothetical protein
MGACGDDDLTATSGLGPASSGRDQPYRRPVMSRQAFQLFTQQVKLLIGPIAHLNQ